MLALQMLLKCVIKVRSSLLNYNKIETKLHTAERKMRKKIVDCSRNARNLETRLRVMECYQQWRIARSILRQEFFMQHKFYQRLLLLLLLYFKSAFVRACSHSLRFSAPLRVWSRVRVGDHVLPPLPSPEMTTRIRKEEEKLFFK